MKTRDLVDLLLLAALWGASFLFMRYAVPAFGVAPLMWLRVAIAALCLVPLLAMRGGLADLRRHAGAMVVMGLFNSAIPFMLIAWATLSVTAGLAAILNATTPIFAALIATLWLREPLGRWRATGLAIGLAGVSLLAADKADFKPGGTGWALLASLSAALSYGFSANHTRRCLGGVTALANAAGSQLVAALALAPLAWWFWPEGPLSSLQWLCAIALGVGCTALAYQLYFRLIGRIGAARTVTVTFLVPLFATVWGAMLLGEPVTADMLVGGAVVLMGTGMATGALRWPSGR
ncbi:threonine/homoserine efflux transporter RhtA [Sphaerotilus hippei]|uniref:Threonine/homoserine efflux transporter RhtA n=1 Tax=Sphaerotilus hippei TaxID=744406 RepID=A0A318H7Y1_9BURK|nr:DMT family transporter [Sphaerotilus hippei]PXW97952.1 threonine/homoserine efflux transporter RhtA [Sphaerotilus hippei]